MTPEEIDEVATFYARKASSGEQGTPRAERVRIRAMILELHPQIRIEKLTLGREGAPLVVIDNFVAEPGPSGEKGDHRAVRVGRALLSGHSSEGAAVV